MPIENRPLRLLLTLAWVVLLSFFFAQTEIQIEGAAGWAANLPTWRIEHHWLLDIFWGGRAMTGYHAWIFPCIALFFHFPLFFLPRWSWRVELQQNKSTIGGGRAIPHTSRRNVTWPSARSSPFDPTPPTP